MPLEAPNLDTRTFADLKAEALLRIARYNPDWTDFNESDPGITLVELFAWFTELMLYQFNQIPDLNYVKFLQLLGQDLRPAQPATAHLAFTATPGTAPGPIPQGTQIVANSPAGGDPLIFETDDSMDMIRVPLDEVQVFDGSTFTVVTKANDAPGTGGYYPLGVTAQTGAALYLGFTPLNPSPPPTDTTPMFPAQIRLRVYLTLASQVGTSVSADEAAAPLVSPVQLVWEYRPASDPTRWQQLNVFTDETTGFTIEGYVLLQGPSDITATVEGKVTDPLFWLRARLAGGSYPSGTVPQVDFVRSNTVPIINLATVTQEQPGTSDGTPSQTFTLAHTPVVPDSLDLQVVVDTEDAPESWTQVNDFLGSGSEDTNYVFSGGRGLITFGDGTHGLIPSAGAAIVANQYRFGGGTAGNLPAGAINTAPAVVGLASVTNDRPAVGGLDEQAVSDLMQQAPNLLRSQNRAVTSDDFSYLASQAGGVAKATAIPLMHPDYPGVEVPGAITVAIVPDNDDSAPAPSTDLLRSVATYLNQFRLITTELYVKQPVYFTVAVQATVQAQPYASSATVELGVLAALNYYLDPLGRLPASGQLSAATLQAAGTDEWNFGDSLHPTSLFSVILGVNGVVFVSSLQVSVNGQPWPDLSQPIPMQPQPDGLLCSGNHLITVVPYTKP